MLKIKRVNNRATFYTVEATRNGEKVGYLVSVERVKNTEYGEPRNRVELARIDNVAKDGGGAWCTSYNVQGYPANGEQVARAVVEHYEQEIKKEV